MDDTDLLNTHHAAQLLGLSPATLNTWRSKRGRISRDGMNGPQFMRMGRTIRYRRCDLNAWIESHPVFQRS
jgi:predicted DNA-binding transcriptional regulator AlpA